jgi:hypothetical protein
MSIPLMFSKSCAALMENSQNPRLGYNPLRALTSHQRTNANHSTVQPCDFLRTAGARNDCTGAASAR